MYPRLEGFGESQEWWPETTVISSTELFSEYLGLSLDSPTNFVMGSDSHFLNLHFLI